MKKHLTPAPSEIVERFKFNSRFRWPGESVSSYMAELRALEQGSGINDETTQRESASKNVQHLEEFKVTWEHQQVKSLLWSQYTC